MSSKILRTTLVAGLTSLNTAVAAETDWQVWTATETRHVLRSEPPGRQLAVKVGAARNERVSFQILVRSAVPLPGVRVEAGPLPGPRGKVLGTTNAGLYRQHQLRLDTGTYRNDAFKRDWYPDPLIPFEHPMRGEMLTGARLRAVPFDLPANETHGFWVDLYVPTNAAAGDYRGVYRVATARQSRNQRRGKRRPIWIR